MNICLNKSYPMFIFLLLKFIIKRCGYTVNDMVYKTIIIYKEQYHDKIWENQHQNALYKNVFFPGYRPY